MHDACHMYARICYIHIQIYYLVLVSLLEIFHREFPCAHMRAHVPLHINAPMNGTCQPLRSAATASSRRGMPRGHARVSGCLLVELLSQELGRNPVICCCFVPQVMSRLHGDKVQEGANFYAACRNAEVPMTRCVASA